MALRFFITSKTPKTFIALFLSYLGVMPLLSLVSAQGNDIFGTINAPKGVAEYNDQAGSQVGGLMIFFSNIIKISAVFAGIWVMINFILAGWIYITSSGDSNAASKVSSKLNMSLIGIMLIVGAYTIAALIGLIIFGDVNYIINPTLIGI